MSRIPSKVPDSRTCGTPTAQDAISKKPETSSAAPSTQGGAMLPDIPKIFQSFASRLFGVFETITKSALELEVALRYSEETTTVAKIIFAETGGKIDQLIDIADVIANRARTRHKTPFEVVTERRQFSCLNDKSNQNWTDLTNPTEIKDWIQSYQISKSTSQKRIDEMKNAWDACLVLAQQMQSGNYQPRNSKILFFAATSLVESKKQEAFEAQTKFEAGWHLFRMEAELKPEIVRKGGHVFYAFADS